MIPFNDFLAAQRPKMVHILSTISQIKPEEGIPVAIPGMSATAADKKAAIITVSGMIESNWDAVELRLEPAEAAALLHAIRAIR